MTDESPWGNMFYPPVEVPKVVAFLGSLGTTQGDVKVFQTTDPFPKSYEFRQAYVALVDGQPAMFVTFTHGGDSSSRHVNVVWARPDVRGRQIDDSDGVSSFPVRIGRWLFYNGYLTHHSKDRTPAGDRWASQVGGEIPPILPENDPARGSTEGTEASSRRAYELLCRVEWGATPLGPEAVSQ